MTVFLKKIIAIGLLFLLLTMLTSCSGKNQLEWTVYPPGEMELISLVGDNYFSATLTNLSDDVKNIRMYVEEYRDGSLIAEYKGPALPLLKERPKGNSDAFSFKRVRNKKEAENGADR
jgi:hypothetical protein